MTVGIAALLGLVAVAPQGDADLRRAMLAVHNGERGRVGAPPMVWDETLAVAARGYAREMARTRRFQHSGELARLRQSENLFVGTRGAYSYREMAGLWAAEKRYFVNGVTPDFSTTGNWRDVAHYTLMIWPATVRMGCAIASNRQDDYLVCRYTPPGNVVGQRAIPARR